MNQSGRIRVYPEVALAECAHLQSVLQVQQRQLAVAARNRVVDMRGSEQLDLTSRPAVAVCPRMQEVCAVRDKIRADAENANVEIDAGSKNVKKWTCV